jgi:hypothetical protein
LSGPVLAPQETIMALLDLSQQNPVADSGEDAKPAEKMPPAGPHDRPELTNFDLCPGAGALPSQREMGWESDPGAG